MKSLLLLIEGDDELRPVVKELQAKTVTGAQNSFERTLSNKTKIIAVTADAAREFSPDYVLSAGTCGALVQGLEVSDWVVTGDVRAIGQAHQQWSTLDTLQDHDETAAPRLCQALKQTPRWHEGRLVTVADEPIHCAMAKARSRRSMRRLQWTWKVMASHERPPRKGCRGWLRGSSSIHRPCRYRTLVR